MTYKISEYCNTHNTNYQNKFLREYEVSGNTYIQVFRNAYPYERTLRYCNGYWIEFNDKEMNKKYHDWKANGGVDFNLYYGGGIVD